MATTDYIDGRLISDGHRLGQEDEHAIIAAWPSKHADVVSNERLLLGVIHLRQASEKKPTCASGYSGALDQKDQNGFHQLLRATEGLIDWKNTFVHASIHVMGEFLMSLAEMLLRVGPTGLTMFAEKLERPTRDDIESGRAKISFKKSILNVEWHFATKKDMRAWSVECVEMLKFVSGDKSKEGGLGALAQAMQTLAGICGGVEDFCKTSKVRKRMVDAMASMKTNVSTFFAGASDDTRALLVEWMEASVERLAKVEGRVVQLEQRMDNKDKEVEKVTDEVEVLKKALASLASTVDKNRDASAAALSAEAEQRKTSLQQAEQRLNQLQGNLQSEAEARKAGDDDLKGDLESEEEARKAKDAQLEADAEERERRLEQRLAEQTRRLEKMDEDLLALQAADKLAKEENDKAASERAAKLAALEEQLRTLRDQQECDRKANEKKAEELARARAIEAGKYQKAKAKLEEEVQRTRRLISIEKAERTSAVDKARRIAAKSAADQSEQMGLVRGQAAAARNHAVEAKAAVGHLHGDISDTRFQLKGSLQKQAEIDYVVTVQGVALHQVRDLAGYAAATAEELKERIEDHDAALERRLAALVGKPAARKGLKDISNDQDDA